MRAGKMAEVEVRVEALQEGVGGAREALQQQLAALAAQVGGRAAEERSGEEGAAWEEVNAQAGRVRELAEKLEKLEDLVSTMAEGMEEDGEEVQLRLDKLEALLLSPGAGTPDVMGGPERKSEAAQLRGPPSASLLDGALPLDTVDERSDDGGGSRPASALGAPGIRVSRASPRVYCWRVGVPRECPSTRARGTRGCVLRGTPGRQHSWCTPVVVGTCGVGTPDVLVGARAQVR